MPSHFVSNFCIVCMYYKKFDLKGCVTSRNFLPICKVLSFSLIFLVMMNNDLEVVPCLMILSCWVVVPSSSLVCSMYCIFCITKWHCSMWCIRSFITYITKAFCNIVLFPRKYWCTGQKYIPWYFLEIQNLVLDTFSKCRCSLHT